jgi:hypothetical protein
VTEYNLTVDMKWLVSDFTVVLIFIHIDPIAVMKKCAWTECCVFHVSENAVSRFT